MPFNNHNVGMQAPNNNEESRRHKTKYWKNLVSSI